MLTLPVFPLFLSFSLSATAAAPSDVSVTSVGASGSYSAAVAQGEVAGVVGQRLRWTLSDGDTFQSRVLLNGRLVYEVMDQELRWLQIRQVGVALEGKAWELDVGRHPVLHGGPRLVDGLQARLKLGENLRVGLWGGLAPDLFTTLPRMRYGGGPMVAYQASNLQGSLVGELLIDEEGEIDRAATLARARFSVDRLLDVSGRLDLELLSEEGGPHLTDGQLVAILRPSRTLRFDLLYNAFSSYRYLRTEVVDPTLQRFAERILDAGIDPGITQDFRDPTIHHLGGLGVRWEAEPSDGPRPRALMRARYRHNAELEGAMARVGPQVGLGQIPVGGFLDVAVDGNVILRNAELQYDAGILLLYEPGEDSMVALDASGRLLINPQYDALGWYADLFVDVLLPARFTLVAGVSATNEPYEELPDLGVTGFLRLTKYLRPAARER